MTEIPSAIPENEEFLSGESKQLVAVHVSRMMRSLSCGKAVNEIIADALFAAESPDASDSAASGLLESRGNADFLAGYIIDRVADHADACAECSFDLETGIRTQLDELTDGCSLPQSIRRMHQMNESLKIAADLFSGAPLRSDKKAPDSALELPAYRGAYDEAALQALRSEVSGRVAALTLSDDLLQRYTRALRARGDVCIASAAYARESMEIKSIAIAAIYLLARKGLLPEAADEVSLDAIITSVCLWADMQCIAGTVRAGQDAFENTCMLLNCAFAAAILTLFVVLLKTGSLKWLAGILLAHPFTLLIAIAAAFALAPAVVSALQDAQLRIADRASALAVDRAQTAPRFTLNPGADRIADVLETISRRLRNSPQTAPDAAPERVQKSIATVRPTVSASE